jgi:hypothetical protein
MQAAVTSAVDGGGGGRNLLSQWVSSVVNVESKSEENLSYLNSILGPVKETDKYGRFESQSSRDLSTLPGSNAGLFEHEIIFKINERVYIEEVSIYEKACGDSSLLKIEALKVAEQAARNSGEEPQSWFVMWQTDKRLESTEKQRVFKPVITPTPFKTDTIKLSISGSLRLIDAIGKILFKLYLKSRLFVMKGR